MFSLSTAVRGILLDIEGTTTAVDFVYGVLFPFARAHLSDYLNGNRGTPELEEIIASLKLEHENDILRNLSPPQWSSPDIYVHWLMDQDRKSTALKALQGRIWFEGYSSGKLHGQVFPDVPHALARWQSHGLDVRIFSSGSTLAQRLLFSTTESGDLTRFLTGYFDTTSGPKTDPASYLCIAEAFGLAGHQLVFISDVTRELDAARGGGLQTLLCVRPGNPPQPTNDYPTISSFDDIVE